MSGAVGKHGQTLGHSRGVALGRHRPLPSADLWEPTQSVNKVKEQPRELVSSGLIKRRNSLYTSLLEHCDTLDDNVTQWNLAPRESNQLLVESKLCVCV